MSCDAVFHYPLLRSFATLEVRGIDELEKLGIPIMPIKISGTEQILPPGASFPKRGLVTVTFGKPLWFRFEEPAEIVEKTRQAVEKL